MIGSVTRIKGGHNLKFGGEYRRNFLDYNQPGYPAGSFGFNRQVTSEDRFAGSTVQGNGFASMLLGWGSGSRFDHTPWSYNTNEYYGGYVHDDWKLTRKLTLNLGLRYEMERPHWEKEYRESFWNLDDPSPLNGKVPGYDLRGFFMFTDEKTPQPVITVTTTISSRESDSPMRSTIEPPSALAMGCSTLCPGRRSGGAWAQGFTSSLRWNGAAIPTSRSTPS